MFLVLFLLPIAVHAGSESAECKKLSYKVTDSPKNYSVYADIYGIITFTDIQCAIQIRNTDLCATEMATFDATAKVYDIVSGRELEMSKSFFVVETPGETRITAFERKNDAEIHITDKGGGRIITFDQLTNYAP